MQSRKRSLTMAVVLTIGGYIKNVLGTMTACHFFNMPFNLQQCLCVGGLLSSFSIMWNFFIIRFFSKEEPK